MKKSFAVLAALVGLAAISFAQQDRQPRGKVEAMVHGKKVVIDYGRPALKGRSLDALMEGLPEDRMWRAGENQVTTLMTDADLKIGGKSVPAGKYSLYIHAPADGNWSLCVNKNLGIELGKIYAQAPPEMAKEMWPRLDGYQKNIAGDEVARIPMMKGDAAATDVFTIAMDGGQLSVAWGDQSYKVGVE